MNRKFTHSISWTVFLMFLMTGLTCSANGIPYSTEGMMVDERNVNAAGPTAIPTHKTEVSNPTPTIQLTSQPNNEVPSSGTFVPHSCSTPDGYEWSHAYQDSQFISTILPIKEGGYYIAGRLRQQPGTWLARLNAEGIPIWQNVYGNEYGVVEQLGNGHIGLSYGRRLMEISTDGAVLRHINVSKGAYYQPQNDGSFVLVGGGWAARYKDSQTLVWQAAIKDGGAAGVSSIKGGGYWVYLASYVDKSVYWAPILTDIHVIRVAADGKTWQKTYGRLVGDETLDWVQSAPDGGIVLAGTHYYEALGSDYDVWLMKLNSGGGISWQTTLKLAPGLESIQNLFTLSKGYLVVVPINYGEEMVLVRLAASGSLSWQKIITSSRGSVTIHAAADTPDGGLLLAGSTDETSSIHFLARLDSRGNLLWEKMLGFDVPGAYLSEIDTFLAQDKETFLIAGDTDLSGPNFGWLAKIRDHGQPDGLIIFKPASFKQITTLGNRPALLNPIVDKVDVIVSEMPLTSAITSIQVVAACLGSDAQLATPVNLPTLKPSTTPTLVFNRDLHLTDPRMEGPDVLKMQQRLLELGYTEVGKPDGVFGPMTETAVRKFQERNLLEVDGWVGPKTWKQLFAVEAVSK